MISYSAYYLVQSRKFNASSIKCQRNFVEGENLDFNFHPFFQHQTSLPLAKSKFSSAFWTRHLEQRACNQHIQIEHMKYAACDRIQPTHNSKTCNAFRRRIASQLLNARLDLVYLDCSHVAQEYVHVASLGCSDGKVKTEKSDGLC